ncbi:hypothetical protein T4A_13276 [Trichinella pseudospiralis]|uniref:Uncharacterized protein n=1 Tax=Trichinella pseudospiralis TaxID=6337 RepID=A0A0V1DJK4_TRIPS|nr:hypothetical protein T4A_13276 [Trichinella pseudospiralis]
MALYMEDYCVYDRKVACFWVQKAAALRAEGKQKQ